jgi:AraC-type transcriptional regulator N-terminus
MKTPKYRDASVAKTAAEMRAELGRRIANRAVAEGDAPTAIPGLHLYRRSSPTSCVSAAYEPSLVVFVQGQKRINVGKASHLVCCESRRNDQVALRRRGRTHLRPEAILSLSQRTATVPPLFTPWRIGGKKPACSTSATSVSP